MAILHDYIFCDFLIKQIKCHLIWISRHYVTDRDQSGMSSNHLNVYLNMITEQDVNLSSNSANLFNLISDSRFTNLKQLISFYVWSSQE